MTIRVRPLANLAVLAACGSAFEFDEVARAHRDQKCLGDLFDAAVVQSDERIGGSDAAITRQAHAFDAIAKVVNEEKDAPRKKSIDSLAPSVLGLVRDDDLLPDITRSGVTNAAIQQLAPSPLRLRELLVQSLAVTVVVASDVQQWRLLYGGASTYPF